MDIVRRIARLQLCLLLSGVLLILLAASGAQAAGAPPPARTASPPTAAELQTFVKKAVAYVHKHGKSAALKEFSDPNGKFRDGALYIFATDFSGICLAQGADPSKVGQNLIDMTDIHGVKVVQKQIAMSRTGGGWLSYTWPDPAHGDRQEPKLSYVLKAGSDWYVGSGTYGPAATKVPTRHEVKALVDKAYRCAKAHGKRAAFARFMDPRRTYWVGQLYVFVNSFKGIVLCYPPDPSWIGMDRWNVQDANGKYYVRDLVHMAKKHGSGWVRYLYEDPVRGTTRAKTSYVRKGTGSWFIGAGTYLTGG